MKYLLLCFLLPISAHASWWIPDSSIGSNKIQTGAIIQSLLATRSTGQSVPLGGIAATTVLGSVSTSSTTMLPVNSASVSIVTSGRPVLIIYKPYDSTPNAVGNMNMTAGTTSANAGAELQIYRTGSSSVHLGISYFELDHNGAVDANWNYGGPIMWIDIPAAGTYTYSLYFSVTTTNMTLQINNYQLWAYEL